MALRDVVLEDLAVQEADTEAREAIVDKQQDLRHPAQVVLFYVVEINCSAVWLWSVLQEQEAAGRR